MLRSTHVSDQCPPISLPDTSLREIAKYAKTNTKNGLVKNNRKGINHRINNHKLVFHGVPLPPAPQPQQPKRQKMQPAGEGRWIKPVDSPNVQAKWYPKSTTSKSTWVPIANPPKCIHESSDEDDGLIGGFSLD